MARLFIAIDTPPDVAAALLHVVPSARGVRPVPAGQLHLTLRFLGDQDDAAAVRIDAALRGVGAPPVTMRVAGVGRFRGVLWAGIAPDPALHSLFDEVQSALAAIGIAPDARRFHPHLTVARCQPGVPDAVPRAWLAAHRDLALPPWRADRFILFESFLSPQGARHGVRGEYGLAARGPGL